MVHRRSRESSFSINWNVKLMKCFGRSKHGKISISIIQVWLKCQLMLTHPNEFKNEVKKRENLFKSWCDRHGSKLRLNFHHDYSNKFHLKSDFQSSRFLMLLLKLWISFVTSSLSNWFNQAKMSYIVKQYHFLEKR